MRPLATPVCVAVRALGDPFSKTVVGPSAPAPTFRLSACGPGAIRREPTRIRDGCDLEKNFQADLFQRGPGREIAKYHGIKAIGPSFGIGQHGSGPFTDSTRFGAEVFHPARVVNVR